MSRHAYEVANGTTTYFVCDGDKPVVEETASTTTGANGLEGTITAAYGYTADGLRSRWDPVNAFTWHYLYDPSGNLAVRQWITQSGTTANYGADDVSIYEGYGALRQCAAPKSLGWSAIASFDPLGFGGQYGYYTDLDTGLVFCTHRYYDPSTGRWLTRDPIGTAGGVNEYAYCGGNPVNAADPEGLIDDAAPSWGALWSQAWNEGTKSLLDHVQKAPSDWISQVGNFLNNAQNKALDTLGSFQFGQGGVYGLYNDDGKLEYVGRTNDLSRRQGEWSRDAIKGELKFRVLAETNSKAAQRGIEQRFYDVAIKEGNPLLNKIRPIAERNKKFLFYLEESRKVAPRILGE